MLIKFTDEYKREIIVPVNKINRLVVDEYGDCSVFIDPDDQYSITCETHDRILREMESAQ